MNIVPMSVEYVDHMGSDVNVVNAARVSFNKVVDEFTDKDAKLLSYLAKHDHWSPFAHTSISIRIKAPMFLAAQFKKHQIGLTWNEVSRRYVSSEPEFYWPAVWHNKPDNVKQGSSDEANFYMLAKNVDCPQQKNIEQSVKEDLSGIVDWYSAMISCGVAPEEARMILPQNTMTEWVWTGSAMAFARVIKQRVGGGAQRAAGELAEMIKEVVVPCYPATFAALLCNEEIKYANSV